MIEYFFHNFTAIILLLYFAATGETMMRSDEEKTRAAIISSFAAAPVQPEDNKLVMECFADFLVEQFGQKTIKSRRTRMPGGGFQSQFVVEAHLVKKKELEEFMKRNGAEITKLWNCINEVRPFSTYDNYEDEGVKGDINDKIMADLIDIFHMEIAEKGLQIAPSKCVQEKLYNAQCLLDLGVIEGKILMEKPEKSANYEPSEKSKWFQELKEADKVDHQIVIGKKGDDYMKQCLKKGSAALEGSAFDVKIVQKPELNDQYLLFLHGNDRKLLLKIISKQVPFSVNLLLKIELNHMQKQCFADLFVSHFEAVTEMRGEQFVVEQRNFPKRKSISDLIIKETGKSRKKKQPFLDCLIKSASPYQKHLNNLKNVDNLVQEFYGHTFHEVVLSTDMQRKFHNAQCWRDLGALEGKIKMQHVKLMENLNPVDEINPWLEELISAEKHQQSIVVSPEGVAHLESCLHKGTASLEPNLVDGNKFTPKNNQDQRHLVHLSHATDSDRTEFLKFIKKRPFSEELNNKINTQSDCLAKFLVIKYGNYGKCLRKKWTTPKGYFFYGFEENDPFHPYIVNFGVRDRAYALSAENCQLPEEELGIYSVGSAEFSQLKDCVVRKTTDMEGKEAIDVRDLLKMHIPEQLYLHGYPVEFFTPAHPDDNEECSICSQKYEINEHVVLLPCKHKVHHDCMQEWIKVQDTCPLCRAEILENVPADPKEIAADAEEELLRLMRMNNE